jgi:hypothetical protein
MGPFSGSTPGIGGAGLVALSIELCYRDGCLAAILATLVIAGSAILFIASLSNEQLHEWAGCELYH